MQRKFGITIALAMVFVLVLAVNLIASFAFRTVKADLTLTYSDERISAHGGLELFRRYFVAMDLAGRLREAFRGLTRHGDYGPVRMVLCLIGFLLAGDPS